MSYNYIITTPYRQVHPQGLTSQQLAEEFWDKLGQFGTPTIAENELDKKTIAFSLQDGLPIWEASQSLNRLRGELESMYPNVDFDFLPAPV